MQPFAERKAKRTDRRKPILLLLAGASLSIWYFDLVPELQTVSTGSLDATSGDTDLDSDDFIAMLESAPTESEKPVDDGQIFEAIPDPEQDPLLATLVEPSAPESPSTAEPAFAAGEEMAARPTSSEINQVAFEQTELPRIVPAGRDVVLSAELADRLKQIDAWIAADETLEAHAALSRLYWQKPESRTHLYERLARTAADIYANPNRHFADPYMVEFGDTLESIAKEHNVPWQYFARLNNVTPETLQAGQTIKVLKGPFSAVVDLNSKQLTLHAHGWFVRHYRVGIGKDHSTPVGEFTVQEKLENPTWYNPDGGVVDADDPANPLGEYWIGLGNHIGIHGTIDPDSIGASTSRGCIHLNDSDIVEVYQLLGPGSSVVIR